ncbi:MAG: hypothetical protein QOD87_41 [Pseudonocardiales bacterium]|nr:hypothetical protein [Pseudonocardiales bacterium]
MRIPRRRPHGPERPTPNSATRPGELSRTGLEPSIARARLVLMSAYAANGLLFSTWFSRLPAMANRLHIAANELAVVTIALTVATLAAIPVAARELPHWRATRIVRVTAPLTALAMLVAVTSTQVWQLVLALLLLGAVNGIQGVGLNAHATTLSRLANRPFMPAMIGSASAAAVFGSGLATVATAGGVPLMLHLGLVAGLCLVTGLAVNRQIPIGGGSSSIRIVRAAASKTAHRLEQSHRPGRPGTSRPANRLDVGRLDASRRLRAQFGRPRERTSTGTDPVMRLLIGAALGASVAEGGIATFAIVIFRDVVGARLALATLAFTVFSIAMASVRLAGGWLMTAVGPRLTLTLGGTLAAVSGLAMVSPLSLPAAFVALIGIATGIACAVPVTLHLATEHAGGRAREVGATDDRATAQALSRLGLATGGGYLAGGPLLGLVAAMIGLRSSIVLVAIGGAALAGCAGVLGMWAHAGSRRELAAPPGAAASRSAEPASVSTRELARART